MTKLKYTALILLVSFTICGQQDFNNFQPLVSIGDIPSDFFVRTSKKIEEDMKEKKAELSTSQQKIFLEGIHYGIDEILQSGDVIYNDEISNYIQNVADKLLKSEPKLRKKLRFYTIKSNATNAFSTDQGIVLVTTGLMSQLVNEAQLAFILAHEISHYIENHVVEGFEYRTRNRGLNSQIIQLSQYSKDKESEADSLGVAIYNKAGYSRDVLSSAFDVLMYSYLPIDELPFPKDYFNSSTCFIPEDNFADKKYEIKVEEDYDDSRSSHPNIRKRKDLSKKVADQFDVWGNQESFLGKEKFIYIRNLARFESVRSDIIELKYGKALYTIFILEKDFPNSLYLHRMKAQCWHGLSLMKNGKKFSQTVNSNSELEGESAGMHVLLKNLRRKELSTLAVRVVEDCRKKYPDDEEIKELSARTNDILFESYKFDLSKYKPYSFQEAINALNEEEPDSSANAIINTEEKSELSKYDKIKKSKQSDISEIASIDSSEYYYYMLSDLMEDESFLQSFKDAGEKIKQNEEAERKFKALSRAEQKKRLKEQQKDISMSSFILVEPAVISYKKGKVDHTGSAKMEDKVIEGFEFISEELDLKIKKVGRSNMDQIGTNGFNQKSFFNTLLMQIANAEGENVFPVDYSLIKEMQGDLSSNKLVFSIVKHTYRPQFNPQALYLIFTGPGILGYLPIPFIKGNHTELDLMVVDLEKAKVVSYANYYFNEPLNRHSIESKLYDIFHQKAQ